MCGIAGIVGGRDNRFASRSDIARTMLGSIRYRGPDQFGVYHDDTAALGSARLSIIDLKTGQQPICNEDGSLWIVFNGEIFNYIELRAGLIKKGHRFATNTDTEVILHLYEEYGERCLRHLNGQFALAIWNSETQHLFLARDRIGIRPLFYTESSGALIFASEIKALFTCPRLSAELDPLTVDQVFVHWSPLPGRTAFKGIRQLPPGHCLTWANGEVTTKEYWDVTFPDAGVTADDSDAKTNDLLDEFKELLWDSALVRLRSDVPVGAYLSGGLDSSIIAHIIASKSGRELTTFSLAFDDPDFDESIYQLRVSRALGTQHDVVRIASSDIVNSFPATVWHAETPVTRTAPAAMFLLSQRVHESGFKVVLTGEGADEFLAGYNIFKESAIRRFWSKDPQSRLRPKLLKRLYPDIAGFNRINESFLSAFFRSGLSEVDSPYYSHLIRWRNNSRNRRFFSRETQDAVVREAADPMFGPQLPAASSTWGALQLSQYLEIKLFLSEYLLCSQGDRMAMANSVESRLPYLDYRLVEFCNRLPSNLKLRVLKDKYLLREYGREVLDSEVWRRPKRPFRAPIHSEFFCNSAPDYVAEMLDPRRIEAAGLFKADAVSQLVRKYQGRGATSETDDMALAGILSTQLLHYQFVENFIPLPAVSITNDNLKICTPCSAVRG